MKNLAVFVSGSGTNLENLSVKIEKKELTNCRIELVVCDNPDAFALTRAKNHNLKTFLVARKDFKDKTQFETAIINELVKNKIDFVILAGYMKIVGPDLLQKFERRIINIHPAHLPEFPGAHAIQDAFKASVTATGVTVHFVDSGIDTGPIIMQEKVARLPEDTIQTFEERIHRAEYVIYPKAIQKLVDGKL